MSHVLSCLYKASHSHVSKSANSISRMSIIKQYHSRQVPTQEIPAAMRAWQAYDYGDYTKLSLNTAARTPHITAPDHILVKVKAVSINPMDSRMLNGYGSVAFRFLREQVFPTLKNAWGSSVLQKKFYGTSDFLSLVPESEFPLTIGRDFSGVVVGMGQDSHFADGIKLGDDVFGAVWPFMNGTMADYVLVPRSFVAKKPAEMSHVEAASLAYVGLTAIAALNRMAVFHRQTLFNQERKLRVLIIGASGGVGIIATQLCLAWGYHVSVTCPDIHVHRLEELGAHRVIPRSRVSELVALDGPYFAVLDCVYDKPLSREDVQDRQIILDENRFFSIPSYITLRQPLLRLVNEQGPIIGTGMSISNWWTTNFNMWRRGTSELTQNQSASSVGSLLRFLSFPKPLLFSWAFFCPDRNKLEYLSKLWEKERLETYVSSRIYHFEDEVPLAVQKVSKDDKDVASAALSSGEPPDNTFGKTVVRMDAKKSLATKPLLKAKTVVRPTAKTKVPL